MSGRGEKRLGTISTGAVGFGVLMGRVGARRGPSPRSGVPGRLKWMVLGRKLLNIRSVSGSIQS